MLACWLRPEGGIAWSAACPGGERTGDHSYSVTKEGLMTYRTMNTLDTYAFWGVVAALVCFLWWAFTTIV